MNVQVLAVSMAALGWITLAARATWAVRHNKWMNKNMPFGPLFHEDVVKGWHLFTCVAGTVVAGVSVWT